MSGKTRNTIGQVFSVVGTVVGEYFSWTGYGAIIGAALIVIGSWLQYDGQKRMQKEAERRARSGSRASSVKGNVRGSYEHHTLVFGEARIGGIVVATGTQDGADSANEYLYIGIAHSLAHAGGCQGISDIWLDDNKITAAQMSGDPNAGAVDVNAGAYAGLVQLRHYQGTGMQNADATLVVLNIDANTAYRRGIAWSWVRVKKTPDDAAFRAAFRYGIPTFTVKLKGIKCYDPRLDSTNGGSGAHRLSDPTTWAWTNNPILCAATYSIMAIADGGMGLPSARIDWPSVASAASTCEEQISTPGGNINRFTCNGVLSTADKRDVNLQKLLDSCMGKRVRVGNKYKFYAAVYRTPTVAIDQTWLAGAVQVTTRSPLESLYNAVRINFDDASQDYKTIEAPPYTSATYEAQDGGYRVWSDLNLPMVSGTYNAQYLAQILHKRSREQMILTLHCNLKALDVELWEMCTVSLPDAGIDLTAYVFRVAGWEYSEKGIILSLQKDNSTVYSVGAMQVPNTGTAPTVGADTPPQITGLSAAGTPDGIQLTFSLPPAYVSTRIRIERSGVSGGPYTLVGYAGQNSTTYTDAVVAGTYYYKLRAVSYTGTLGPYSAEVSATAKYTASSNSVAAFNSGFEDGDRDWAKGAGWSIVLDANARSGSWCAKLPGTGGSQSVAISNNRALPTNPGSIIDAQMFFKSTAAANGAAAVRLRWLDSTGTELSTTAGNSINGPAAAYGMSRAIGAAPANAAYVEIQGYVSGFTSAGTEAWYADDALLNPTPKEPYNLTVAGSGQQLGDGRQMIPGVIAGFQALTTANPLTASTGATSTGSSSINVNAFNLQVAGVQISYNAVVNAASGLNAQTQYWLYTDDPNYVGGTKTWTATTSAVTAAAGNGRVVIGPITTPVVNTSNSNPSPDGRCVDAESWLANGDRAINLKLGEELPIRTDTGDMHRERVTMKFPSMAPCVEIESVSGARLICSESTPFTLSDGSVAMAPHMQDHEVLVARDGEVQWELVTRIRHCGNRRIMRISVGGHSFAAGVNPDAQIFSHNIVYK